MCFLGIIDMLAIPLIGFFCAYFATVGVVYCMHPTILYVAGLVGLGFWCSGSTTCMILGFNRCLDLCHPPLARALFGGNKTYIWLLIPTLYFLYIVWFHTTAIFTSTLYAFFFDPFIGMPERNGLVDSIHVSPCLERLLNSPLFYSTRTQSTRSTISSSSLSFSLRTRDSV